MLSQRHWQRQTLLVDWDVNGYRTATFSATLARNNHTSRLLAQSHTALLFWLSCFNNTNYSIQAAVLMVQVVVKGNMRGQGRTGRSWLLTFGPNMKVKDYESFLLRLHYILRLNYLQHNRFLLFMRYCYVSRFVTIVSGWAWYWITIIADTMNRNRWMAGGGGSSQRGRGGLDD